MKKCILFFFLSGENAPAAAAVGLAGSSGAGAGVRLGGRRRPVRRGGLAGGGRHQAARVLPAVRGRAAAAAVLVAHLPPGAGS